MMLMQYLQAFCVRYALTSSSYFGILLAMHAKPTAVSSDDCLILG